VNEKEQLEKGLEEKEEKRVGRAGLGTRFILMISFIFSFQHLPLSHSGSPNPDTLFVERSYKKSKKLESF
jgi:hypothetical protein